MDDKKEIFQLVEDVQLYFKNGGSSEVLDVFFQKLVKLMAIDSAIYSSVFATLASGSFWMDFFRYSKANADTLRGALMPCKLFSQMIQYKSILLLGIELLGASEFRTLLHIHFYALLRAFELYADLRTVRKTISLISPLFGEEAKFLPIEVNKADEIALSIFSIGEMLQMLSNTARIIICHNLDDKTIACDKLGELGFIELLEPLFLTLSSKNISVLDFISQDQTLFHRVLGLIDVVVYITVNNSEILFGKKTLLIQFLTLLGQIATCLTSRKEKCSETINDLRELRARELKENKEEEAELLLSSLYTSATFHLFDREEYKPISLRKEGPRLFSSAVHFLRVFEKKIQKVFRKEKQCITFLLDSFLQIMFRIMILEFWNNDSSTSHQISSRIISRLVFIKSLIFWVGPETKLLKDALLWINKYALMISFQTSSEIDVLKSLGDRCLYYIVAMNYTSGGLNVCFNPSCPSPILQNKGEASYSQTLENNTMLRFLDKDPLRINVKDQHLFNVPILEKCSVCYLMQYCSKDCQRQDWNRHKPHCRNTHQARQSKHNLDKTIFGNNNPCTMLIPISAISHTVSNDDDDEEVS